MIIERPDPTEPASATGTTDRSWAESRHAIISVWRGRFADPQIEYRYRTEMAEDDSRHAKWGILGLGILFALFFWADLAIIHEVRDIVIDAIGRSLVFLGGVICFLFLHKHPSYKIFDRTVMIFTVLVSVIMPMHIWLYIVATDMPPTILDVLTVFVIAILTIYLLVSSPLVIQVSLSCLMMVAFFGLIFTTDLAADARFLIVVGLLAVTNLTGFGASKRVHKLRRVAWARLKAEQANSMDLAIEMRARARATAEVIAAKKTVDKANEAKSKFLAAASHDLRQPLQAIQLYQGALKSYLDEDLELDRAACSTLVSRSAKSLDSLNVLLGALLDLSKLDAQVVPVIKENHRVSDILGLVTDEFEGAARNKGTQLTWVPSTASIHTDEVLLKRIVGNLVSNAVRFTENGRIVVGCRRLPGHLRIEVWDNGEGIPANRLEEIFDEFQQLNNDARHSERGLGLGLSIVKRTAELLEHKVDVRSWHGYGSCFAIEVPLVQEPTAV